MKSIPPFIIHEYLRGQRGSRSSRETRHEQRDEKYKRYPRFPKVSLPNTSPIETSLSQALEERTSATNVRGLTVPSIEIISSVLKHSLAIKNNGRRRAPSGGGLYPIEAYLVGDIYNHGTSAVFHYLPHEHALEHLWELPPNVSLDTIVSLQENKGFPLYIVLTGVWNRSAFHYGNFAHLLGTLEAGHISQNILLCAAAHQLAACPIGGFNDTLVSDLLDIDSKEEQPIHLIALGSTQ